MIRLILALFIINTAFAKEAEPPKFKHTKELELAMNAAKDAGALLMQYWNRQVDLEAQDKDGTPVTAADFASNQLICERLVEAYPQHGLLTEEEIQGEQIVAALSRWKEAEWTWIVDPLDGTKSFIAGRKDFGIHIALLHHGKPVVGVNYYPATKTMYFAVDGCGAYKQVKNRPMKKIRIDPKSKTLLPIVSSRKSEFIKGYYALLLGAPITPRMLRRDFRCVGSCGLRLCLIAEGKRNIYASKGESGSVWDYASGYVILKEAGGYVSDLFGKPLNFLSPDYKFRSGTLVADLKNTKKL